MVLATHLIAGGALTQLAPLPPVVAFTIGFLSHFVLDAIPHWDYRLASRQSDPTDPLNDRFAVRNKRFLFDLIKIAADVLVGLVALYLLWERVALGVNWSLWLGAFGAIAPDALQFIYAQYRWRPLRFLHRFHFWIHSPFKLVDRPFLGISTQILLLGFVIWFILSFAKFTT